MAARDAYATSFTTIHESLIAPIGAAVEREPRLEVRLAFTATRFAEGTISAHLGMRLEEIGDGHAVVALDVDAAKHANPHGTAQGGVIAAIADAAMGSALATSASPQVFAFTSIALTFVRPGLGTLRATGRVIRHGRQLSLVEARVENDVELVATASAQAFMFDRARPWGEPEWLELLTPSVRRGLAGCAAWPASKGSA